MDNISILAVSTYIKVTNMLTVENDMLDENAGKVADRNLVMLDVSSSVADAARLMKKRNTTSMFVSVADSDTPVGIVTERDILYKVVAEGRGPYKVTLGEIMSSPLVSVPEGATVREAVALMRARSIRRIAVVSDGKVVGLLTLMAIVGGSTDSGRVELAEVELPKTACPYCGSKFDDRDEMSKHIDRLHLGSGLLEGDPRRW
ncbi:MAG: CBS domain-containing protein [Nitrososphaera sp.]|jgi:signal-transduction protein with cAMP-binding, CBS, and nucleotidyltransferase domain